jgi:hypoxanthine phosphoribosyltransferase
MKVKPLFTEEQIQVRIRELGNEINARYTDDLVVVMVMTGAMLFASDLVRRLRMPVLLETLNVYSYGNAQHPTGLTVEAHKFKVDLTGKDVLVIDDILDSGNTLKSVVEVLAKFDPRSIGTCVLLDKEVPRTLMGKADFTGFQVPNLFVVGYGLDRAGYDRNLPYIGHVEG